MPQATDPVFVPLPPSAPPVPPFVRSVAETLRGAGHEVWLVGGCVRDSLLGRNPKDWDLVTDARPDRIESLFPRTIDIGKAFGIVTVVPPEGNGAQPVEVATFRAEDGYEDGRHPTAIRFASVREDVLRRDFTINALLMDPLAPGRVLDLVGGFGDLEHRLVRAIGDPVRRFSEDYLRMLRAIRFAATLGFGLDPACLDAIRALAPKIKAISAERIREEIVRTLVAAPRAGQALLLWRDSGLLAQLLPEVSALQGLRQPPEFHPEGDVFTHTRLMLDALPASRSPRLALAVLLHDVGKLPTADYSHRPDGSWRWRFECHADVGAEIARSILQRLKCPNALVDDVVALVANHMRIAEAPRMRPAKLRRLMASPVFDDELELHRLDCGSSHGLLAPYEFLKAKAAETAAEPELPPPLVTGADLIAAGLPPGPAFRPLLARLYDLQLEGQTSKSALLALLPSRIP